MLDITEERLVVISDLHLGSPASRASESLPSFLDHVADAGWSLCVNGDAIDLLQHSVPHLVAAGASVLTPFQRFLDDGNSLYYVLGNHDLVLEHLLQHLPMSVSPILNLRSGDARIRIEHGHVHEPVFSSAPGLYELGGRIGRGFLLLHGDTYRLYARVQRAVHRRRRAQGLDDYPAYRAADALFERGFDAVVMGHTHLPELVQRPGGTYVNGGDWMHAQTFVTIDNGVVELNRWPQDRLT